MKDSIKREQFPRNYLQSKNFAISPKQKSLVSATFLYESSAEALAFLVASVVTNLFFKPFTAPLLGIGCALLTTKLVLKICDQYDNRPLVDLTKEACKFNKKYPKLQLIAFIFSLAISLLSTLMGLLAGIALGSYGAILIDVESYKLKQKANRKDHSRSTAL